MKVPGKRSWGNSSISLYVAGRLADGPFRSYLLLGQSWATRTFSPFAICLRWRTLRSEGASPLRASGCRPTAPTGPIPPQLSQADLGPVDNPAAPLPRAQSAIQIEFQETRTSVSTQAWADFVSPNAAVLSSSARQQSDGSVARDEMGSLASASPPASNSYGKGIFPPRANDMRTGKLAVKTMTCVSGDGVFCVCGSRWLRLCLAPGPVPLGLRFRTPLEPRGNRFPVAIDCASGCLATRADERVCPRYQKTITDR